ncbi:type II secretion system protein [Pseudoroseomonas sp. WGS1072]|uniref:type II secretion system protein n=1 Tax=Roseomonas sp. WGS1072 TaxID=3366816 RepID=UPI003BF1590B
MSASSSDAPRRRWTAPGFTLVEALVALAVIGGVLAALLPALAATLRAKAGREADLAALALAQSLLEAHAPPGAARPGHLEGRAPEGPWRVETGPGEAGAPGLALHPVRVTVGAVVLETLRPGPAGGAP